MYISKKLLTQLIPYINDISNDELAQNFNELAIENESIYNFPKIKGLKLGKILKVNDHFNANSVRVCQVQLKNHVSQIVCGAKTLNVNANVIVAQDDILIADGRVIGTKDFRGVQSEGMMCDYSEISGKKEYISDLDDDEIINFSNDEIKSKKSISEMLNLDDTIFDVSLPSNRNDLNGLLSIANELNGLHNKKIISFELDKKIKFKKLNLVSKIDQSFFGLQVNDIEHLRTNWNTKTLLMNSGIKPLNTIQDIANISSIFSSVPLIGIDAGKIEHLTIEKLSKPIKVKLTNFGEVKLKKDDVVYKSKDQIVAVAGIGECENYQITNQTKKAIFLATKLKIKEFKKTVNNLKVMSNIVKFNLKKISDYYFEQALNNLANTFCVKYPNLAMAKKINKQTIVKFKLNYELIKQILGMNLTKNQIDSCLKRFGIKIEKEIAIMPWSRIDLENNFDLAEEILKLNNINELEPDEVKQTVIRVNNVNDYQFYQNLALKFIAKGFYQLKTYNLTSKENNEFFNWFNYASIEIQNPISIERQYLKLSLLPTMIEVYSYNCAHKNELLPIFEIQKIYHKKNNDFHFSMMIPSQLHTNLLTSQKLEADLHLCKDFLSIIETHYGIKLEYRKNQTLKYTCDNDAIDLYYQNQKVGYVGRMCPNIVKKYKISDEKIYFSEINLSRLKVNEEIKQFVEFENVHPIVKELTFLIENETAVENLYQTIAKAPNVAHVETIGYFKKENGIAISIKFHIINVKQQETKLAFNNIVKFFKENNINIPN